MRFLLLRIFVENEDYSINIEHIAWSTAITSKLLLKLQMDNLYGWNGTAKLSMPKKNSPLI